MPLLEKPEKDELPAGAADQRPQRQEPGGDQDTVEPGQEQEDQGGPAGAQDQTDQAQGVEESDDPDADEQEGDDDDDPRVKAEKARKIKAQRRARAAEAQARELEARLARLEQHTQEQAAADFERRLADEMAQAQAAVQASELAHKEAVEPEEQLAALDKRSEAKERLRQLADVRQRFDAGRREPPPATRQEQQGPGYDPVALAENRGRWVGRNSWYEKATAEEKEAVKLASREVAAEYPLDDPQHFQELDRVLAERLPARYARRAPGASRAAVTAGAGRATAVTPRSETRITDPEFRRNLEIAGYDPDDPAVAKRMLARQAESRRFSTK